VRKYLLDHRRIFDTCDDFGGTTTFVTGRYIDIDYSLEALCPVCIAAPIGLLPAARASPFADVLA